MSYLPHTPEEREAMLARIGVESVDDLFANVPESLRSGPPPIPAGLSEMEVLRLLNAMAAANVSPEARPSFLGGGAYRHYVPAAVGAVVGRSEFYTSYTPYQPEISQGTLQSIYEYQTMIAELTGLDISNASLYDAATGVTEATTIAINETRRERIVLAGGVHPEYRRVAETYLHAQGFALSVVGDGWALKPEALANAIDDTVAGVVVQSPNFWGVIESMGELAEAAHAVGAQFVAVVNPLSLAILAPPGEYGADVALGCGQPLGIPLSYGGPYLGFMAVRSGLERRLPGRIAGATVDAQGRKGYVLTLQAREQHIRREKATSNICTNHALMALTATVYLSLLGREGLRQTALQCVQKAHYAAREIASIPGFSLAYEAPFFNELVVHTPVPADEVNRFLLGRDLIGGLDLGPHGDPNGLLLAFTEMTSRAEIDDLVATLAELVPAETPARTAVEVGGGS